MLEVVVRGVDGNSSSYMVMVGLLMFNVYWVQFKIESYNLFKQVTMSCVYTEDGVEKS